MSTEVSGFALALFVSLLTVVVTVVQARVVTDQIMVRLGLPTLSKAKAQETSRKEIEPLNRHPKIVLAYVAQSLDVATNFPAGILTVYAYMVLPGFPKSAIWVLMVAAIVWTLVSVGLAWPGLAVRYSDRMTLKGCSPLTGTLLIANIIGLIIAARPSLPN